MSNSDASNEDTGRYLMFYYPDALEETAKLSRDVAGINMTSNINEAESVIEEGAWHGADTIVVPSIGVAVCSATPEQMERLKATANSPIRHIRKELIFQLAMPFPADYLQGYRDGVNDVIARLQDHDETVGDFEISDEGSFRDNLEFTWGLQAIGTNGSFTGQGVKVAVLDTGIDFRHPDVMNRNITGKSFIDGIATAQDDNTHGTHCAGTVCGPDKPSRGPRYGVAPDVQLFVGKVMRADGKGREGDILNGIGWAIQNNCRIISLSISKSVQVGELPIREYEQIGKIALNKNCIIIAAAGNESQRPQRISPVTIPANSSTIMAVGAIDRRLAMYNRSNGGINANGGGVDIVAPGVNVISSKILPIEYGTDTGTSMAAPHVAGVAAIHMQADPSASAEQIWTRLSQTARRLPLSSTDVGSGLVQINI